MSSFTDKKIIAGNVYFCAMPGSLMIILVLDSRNSSTNFLPRVYTFGGESLQSTAIPFSCTFKLLGSILGLNRTETEKLPRRLVT